MGTTNYESVLGEIQGLPRASGAELRDVRWLTDRRVVGAARDYDGRVEVFLAGDRLRPVSSVVSDAVEFRTWHRVDAPSIDASRLLFPAMGHFDQVAAFICTELLRNGADAQLPRAFARTEAIIELAIERMRLSDQVILGLVGELLLLDALCRRAVDEQVDLVLRSWDGWRRSSRDFTIGSTGVEVKTTSGVASSHFVEGVHQVEVASGAGGGAPEELLYLVSVGLQIAPAGGEAFTIPQLVERILSRISSAGLDGSVMKMFLGRLSEYGTMPNGGYDHAVDALDSRYSTPYLITFFRAFDMTDASIRVLRRSDIAAFAHVDVGSVRFRVDLPVVASGRNPIVGANEVAEAMLGRI